MLFFEFFFPIVFFFVGLALASFGNVIIYRENSGMGLLSKTRSICPKCEHELAWYDNIPLLSYLILKGKCRYCHEPISKRYPLVELCGGLLTTLTYFVFAYFYEGKTMQFHYLSSPLSIVKSIAYSLILLCLFIGSFTDSFNRNIPLYLSIPTIVLSLGMYVAEAIVKKSYLPFNLISVGIAIVFFVLSYMIGVIFFKREVMGLGDIIILVGLSFSVDFISYLAFVILITLTASIYEMIHMKKKGRREIPFVPYIFLGVLFLAYLAPLFSQWYFGLMGF